ncbi:putative mediator of RNA polymerase II transcription subunit 26 isoform X2 [Chironomus tepperi]|uniref:putative mediator of RNA polymerase II transcription subunit 26 isoform X2 n=1 Tax=Chironomus tepperi TaxID=113505 RepID=UPI00391F7F5D
MATTLQKPPHPSQMDPRMRRAVYAKYREMLVSKNNQANEMIKQLPAYMVREDRGFNTSLIVNDVPPPPPIPGSNIPTQRLQTQISEAPACVQNAMMTKDKKPFTYTPGGIDLSQIKSPRMAKRISANANSPGITNTPKVSPLAQLNNNGSNSPMIQSPQTPQSAGVPPPPPPPPSMGSLAMGMPFQVFPTGPPPPPVPTKTQLNKPQTNGTAKKSPQSFDPPPMGCRPEIKIPENPMASLRKVPRPQPNDDYWIQEYVENKARNSAPNEEEIRQYISSPTIQQYQQPPTPDFTPPKPLSPVIQNIQSPKPPTPQQSTVPQFSHRRSPSPPEQKEVNVPIRNLKLEEHRSSPTRVQINRSSPITQPQQQQQQQSQISSPVTVKNVIFEPIQPTNFNKQAQSYQPPVQNYQQPIQQQPQQQQQPQGGRKIILSTMPNRTQQHQQATQHLGSLYIPPPNIDDKQQLLNQLSPPWMSTKQVTLDTPEWVNRDEVDNLIQQSRNFSMPQQVAPPTGPKEHVIPISFEKSPTMTSAMPNFGPTPFYGTPQHQINSVITPKVDPNANKFVNQGYNNIDYAPTQQQPARPFNQRPQQTAAGTRIIPIQVEGAQTQPNENTIIIQSDPRSPPSPRVNAGGPTQSRSFKILQQVTGTLGDESDDNSNESKPNSNKDDDEESMQEQRPIFSRPLGPNDMNESQLKRMQLSDNDRSFMNRVKNQVDEEVFLHSESDPRYRGSAIPSKAFKCLQKMTDGFQTHNNNDSNPYAAPAGRQVQNNVKDEAVDMQSRDQGLYQSSAMPSRSFKMHQIQPENAVPQTPQMYPPYMMPPQYAALYDWYDPQNNPWAAYYYQMGYDPNYFGYMPPPPMPSHSRSQTPQPSQMSQSQQQQQQQQNGIPPPMPYFYPPYPPVFLLPPYMGFRPISASRETTPCFSEAERYQNMSTASDDRSRRAVSCTPTCCQHAKSFQVENLSNKFHTFEEPLTRSVSVQSENPILISDLPEPPEIKKELHENQHVGYPLSLDKQRRGSLKSIPSVSNMNMYNDECELEELQAKPIVTTCDDDDDVSMTSEDTTEVEEDISQDTETVEIHFPHQLSIIYEENESAAANERRSSICSRSSTLSDCSTTLMEDDNISIDHSEDELEEENSNSVTVRLPLKFSFTRSKDNMVNTTLTVGESESEVSEIQENKLEKSPSPMPIVNSHSHSLSNNSSANDISVTFSLKSKSKSKTPERLLPPTLSAIKCDSIEEKEDSACSVNISLPRRKSRSIEIEEFPKRQRRDSETSENSHSLKEASENSSDNKIHIDNSLYTSLDALEEIKKGMAEITNSLFSKICTLRKSAMNIPEHERIRSDSISYIESIESDDENEDPLSENSDNNINEELPDEPDNEVPLIDLNECIESPPIKARDSPINVNDVPEILRKVSRNLQELLMNPLETYTEDNDDSKDNHDEEETKHYNKDTEIENETYEPKIIEILTPTKVSKEQTPTPPDVQQDSQTEEEDVDFWSQIGEKNQDNDYNLSKTSTHSSRYWFELETDDGMEPPKDDGFAKYETNDITTSVSFVSINDAATIENEEPEHNEFDFWKDYDEDADYGTTAKKFFGSQMKDDSGDQTDDYENAEMSIYEDPIQPEEDEEEEEVSLKEQEIVESKNTINTFSTNNNYDEETQENVMDSSYDEPMEYQRYTESMQEPLDKPKQNLEVIEEISESFDNEEDNIEHAKRPATPYSKTWENKSEYDDDSDTESCKAFENDKIHEVPDVNEPENVKETIQMPTKPQLCKEQTYEDDELESDEEWTEEEVEVTDDDENLNNNVPEIRNESKMEVKNPQVFISNEEQKIEEESEYEESEEEEEEILEPQRANTNNSKFIETSITKLMEPNKPAELKIICKTEEINVVENKIVNKDESSDSGSEDEIEDFEDENINLKMEQTVQATTSIVNSPSRIIKGKSLVNVNTFIKSESDKEVMKEMKEKIECEYEEESDETEDESEDEKIDDRFNEKLKESEQPLPINRSSSNNINSHSNDDCHEVLTQHMISYNESNNNIIDNDNNKVLLSNLKEIHSVDSKSNMTSESGISFENNDPDSEDGYDEDSEDENVMNNSKNKINSNLQSDVKTTKELPQLITFDEESYEKPNEVKVNVKGRISMFERAMSEERVIERPKDIPKVTSKYSFRHRETSEPPSQLTLPNVKNIDNHKYSNRATSEMKEVAKNQKLIDLINQRKSLPPPPTSDENFEKKSVKEKISSYETVTNESDANEKRENYRRYGSSKAMLSPLVRSIEESGEEDSGVTSDFCKHQSENETDSENFPELRKLSRYERASTHSRLYKLLHGDDDIPEKPESPDETAKEPTRIPYKSKKIVHNVSATRRQNPQAALQAETMEERRQRLCLPLTHQSSSGAESMSSSTTPSPTPGPINEKLVNELVQSLLSQKRGKIFRDLPIEKLHAAAVKILQDDMESNGTFSSADESTVPTVDSTPALTPQEFRNNSSYTEYYDSWQTKELNNSQSAEDFSDITLIQSKAFRNLQDQQCATNKKLWSARCPRILSSKSINKDLARLSEVRESESPEPIHSRSPSIRSMSTEPMSEEKRITKIHQNHQERQKAAANT